MVNWLLRSFKLSFAKLFYLLFFLLAINELEAKNSTDEKWIVYYANAESFENFFPYQLVVFDSQSHPVLQPLREKDITLLGYLNLAEVEKERFYFQDVKDRGLLLGENPDWPGSYYIDIRSPEWTKLVIEKLIPYILFQRFDGIFLDTIDHAEYLETKYPEKYSGMKEAAKQLIKTIRLNYPQIKIMLNRGFYLLPDVGGEIDMVLAESILTTYNFQTKEFTDVDPAIYQEIAKNLQQQQKTFPTLKVYTLDYWDPQDTTKIKDIYRIQRENGFIPYVSTLKLDQIIQEPK